MTEHFSRQSFLGPGSESQITDAVFGIIGLGGGGSHIVQQLAHVGARKFVLYDPDRVEESNLNRMVGATAEDAKERRAKTAVATRVILGVTKDAEIDLHQARWQDEPEGLRRCDVIFGCVDGFSERDQLEATCRRHLIPYVDIGLDVHVVGDEPPVMGGQLILSMPGHRCMRCLGFITDKNLALEASRYGDAGSRPQVVWGNGILASAAVGIAIDLITDWTRKLRGTVYLEYRGNDPALKPHPRLAGGTIAAPCPHYAAHDVGDPQFVSL